MARVPRLALTFSAAILGLLLLIAAALFLLVDTNIYKARLEAIASRALGMELSVAGRPGVRVFPGLLLTLQDVNVRRQGFQIASVKQVTVDLGLLSLLGDELRIDKVVPTQPIIMLARDREGRFNFADPSPATSPARAQDWPEVTVTAGSLVFVDHRHGKGFEARDCDGQVHALRRAAGAQADFLKAVSFDAEFGCAQVRRGDLTLFDVKFTADAKNGIVELNPLTARLFGTQGSGHVRADFSGAVATYRITCTLTQFPVETFFATMSLQPLITGRMDFSATLSTRGTTPMELKQAMSGHVSLRGKALTFVGSNLDEAFERFESSQTFSLVDLGAVFFAGPVGLLVTKGYDFANLARGTGGSSEIHTLVSEWKVERGVAQAQDVAMATKANRIALHGGLDLVNERFDDVSVALVDAKGCVKVEQKIRGAFHAPVVEKPNLVRSLAGPAMRLLKKSRDLISGDRCEVFYAGTVAAP